MSRCSFSSRARWWSGIGKMWLRQHALHASLMPRRNACRRCPSRSRWMRRASHGWSPVWVRIFHKASTCRAKASWTTTSCSPPRYPIYIAPKQDGYFLVGATEIESDDLSPMSVRSALELLGAAYTVDSGFGEARIVELVAQCRPALPDNLPCIRQLGPRVMQINGLYRHGYLMAPALLDVALERFETGASPRANEFALSIHQLP